MQCVDSISKIRWLLGSQIVVLVLMSAVSITVFAQTGQNGTNFARETCQMKALKAAEITPEVTALNDAGKITKFRVVQSTELREGQLNCVEFGGYSNSCESVTVAVRMFTMCKVGFFEYKCLHKVWKLEFPGGIKQSDFCD